MFFRYLTIALLTAALATVQTGRATAGSGDFAAGVLTGVVGTVIVNQANKNKPPKRTVVVNRGVYNATRAENRETQVALNYFGFPAGTPDGVLGRKYRAAASGFQAHMGFPVTGGLTKFERDVLVGAYHRGQAGGSDVLQIVATSPDGSRGLLKAQRDMLTGTASTTLASTTTEPTTDDDGGALPLFNVPATGPSLASHCAGYGLTGGYVDVSAGADAVLNEQLCLTRADAIRSGEALTATLAGVSQAQIDEQCGLFGGALTSHVAGLAINSRADVLAGLNSFIADGGQDPVQLTSSARICMSSGYRTDNLNTALGSAMLLVALGQAPYGELVGHHLSQGFGTTTRVDLAVEWYQAALDALAAGAEPVFAPDQFDRPSVVQAAVYQLSGGGDARIEPVMEPGTKAKTQVRAGSN